jgi:hypothetical protein
MILLGIIAKAPDGVASMAGVSTGGFGHGVDAFVTAAGMGYQAGAWAGGAAVQGGKQLGQAVGALDALRVAPLRKFCSP